MSSAVIVPIRKSAPLYITVWNMPDLTLARSGVRIDIRPGSIANEDYGDIIAGLVAAGLVRKVDSEVCHVAKAMTDAELFDVYVGDSIAYRLSPSGWAFQRTMR